eukprot:235886-Prymnesium_polylepis.1
MPWRSSFEPLFQRARDALAVEAAGKRGRCSRVGRRPSQSAERRAPLPSARRVREAVRWRP